MGAVDLSPESPRRRVLVVCHANTSRSIIAEKVLQRLLAEHGHAGAVEVRSGGIAPYARDGSLVSLDARFVLREVGIDLPPDAGATDLKRQRHLLEDAGRDLAATTAAVAELGEANLHVHGNAPFE